MTKTSISVNIDSEVKKQAESILAELDISVSEAITMFYKQIILQQENCNNKLNTLRE